MCYLWYYLTSLAVLLFIVFLSSLNHQIFTFYASNGAYHCSFLSVYLSLSFFIFVYLFLIFSSAMSISFIMEKGDLDSEIRKVFSGPPSTLQLSFQFVRELFTVYIICIVEK